MSDFAFALNLFLVLYAAIAAVGVATTKPLQRLKLALNVGVVLFFGIVLIGGFATREEEPGATPAVAVAEAEPPPAAPTRSEWPPALPAPTRLDSLRDADVQRLWNEWYFPRWEALEAQREALIAERFRRTQRIIDRYDSLARTGHQPEVVGHPP